MNTEREAASVVFDKVTKTFGSVVAVREVSLTVEPGTLVTLLGPSGCGKTTTLRLIAGLEIPTQGKIFIAGKDVSSLPATDRDVSMVFQSYALFPHMTVLQNVSYGLRVSGMKKAPAGEKAEAVLAQVNMPGYGARLPSELSGGQQQRVAVARALVLEPQVLLFDEPLSNLDAKLRRQVRQDIRDLQQDLGLTMVYVTHDQSEALAVSDSIIVMRNAEIAQKGSPRDLYERPEDIFVADFIGDANVVKAEIVRIDGDQAIVRVGEIETSMPHRGLTPGEANLAIRPQSVQLSDAETGSALTGEILKATYLGGHIEYTVATPAGEFFVIDPRVYTMFAPGSSISVSFAEQGVTLVHP